MTRDQRDDDGGFSRREFLTTTAAAASAALLSGCPPPAPPRSAGDAARATQAPPAVAPTLAGFGITAAQVREVIAAALSRGGEYCDLYFERRTVNRLTLEDHAVNRASSESDLGVGIRVVDGLQTGYAYTERLERASMLEAARVAASVADAGPREVGALTLHAARPAALYPARVPWAGVPTADKVALLMRMHDGIAGADKRIRKVNISYRDEHSEILFVDSDGRMIGDVQPMAVCYASCTAEHGGRRESNYSARAARAGMEFFDAALVQTMAREAVARTLVLFDAVPGPVGELPVVLGPGSSGILLHEAIGHGMEADFARKRTTIFTDKIGQRIAQPFVTIVDDGTIRGSRGSINVDDEGHATARTVLVEGGVLRTFMHDRISARHFKLAPTGNGRRESFRHMPIPRMRNTYMVAGPHAREEILRSVKRGIYAEHFTNGQVNIGPGDFTFYVKNGMLIEDGKLTRPVKDINLIGNGPAVLERVTMVGDDFSLDQGGWTCGKRGQGVPVGLGMPTVKVSAITIGGTEKKQTEKAG